jgi:ribosomal protein S18 acetylase RimI-like enzyme
MRVRLLTSDDAAAFRTIRLFGLKETPSAFVSSYEEECDVALELVAGRIHSTESNAVFGAFIGDALVGIAAVQREQRRKLAHRAMIRSVYVLPGFRRRRVARLLLEAALERAFAMPGVQQVHLMVNVTNAPAIALYRSAQFWPKRVDSAYLLVDGVLQDQLHMVRDRAGSASSDWREKNVEPSTFELLSQRLAASRLWSLLMQVAHARAARRMPSDLVHQWTNDRFVLPGPVDPRVQIALDQLLFALAEDFEALELSPLSPLGSCSVVAPGSQNRIVSTMRGTEVLSDPTNALALESARRLRADPSRSVKFAASHRCVRAQMVAPGPGIAAHFRMFCLTSAGQEIKDHGFVVHSLIDHIRFHLNALAELGRRGDSPQEVILTLRSARSHAHLVSRIGSAFCDLPIEYEDLTNNYYDGLRFSIDVRTATGERANLCDGGAFDWLGKLTSNRKFAFLASAIGSQRAAIVFGLRAT